MVGILGQYLELSETYRKSVLGFQKALTASVTQCYFVCVVALCKYRFSDILN